MNVAVQTMRTVHLHGQLGKLYGRNHKCAARDISEIIRWLCMTFDGDETSKRPPFVEYFTKDGRDFMILRGDEYLTDSNQLSLGLGRVEHVHIIPRPRGAKSGSGKFFTGLFLVAATFVTLGAAGAIGAAGLGGALGGSLPGLGITFGQVVGFSGLLALGGLSQMLSPVPVVGDPGLAENPEERSSFLINTIVNTTEEGAPVPVIYGRKVRVGSHVASSGLDVEQVPLSDVLDPETDFESVHNIISIDAGTISCSGNDLEFRGLYLAQLCDETVPFDHSGAFDPALFRNRRVFLVGEQRDTVTDDFTFIVQVADHLPRDYFNLVRVTSQDELTTFISKASGVSTTYVQETNRPAWGSGFFFNNFRVTTWTWFMGNGVGFSMPVSTTVLFKTIFEY